MSPLFRINFRREAFRRERAEARARATWLGVWLTYFGGLAVLLGLYGLNCASLQSRSRALERQIARDRAQHTEGSEWVASPNEAAAVEPWVADTNRWRDLLGRIPRLLPEGARLTGLQWNPDAISGSERKLVLTGVLREGSRADRMSNVTDFVAVLAKDSLITSQFRSVRLVSTRVREGGDSEFQVECQ
ncbi:MAG: PilN domain-containing protein [Candidatus Eisenbacteria bacterium]|nr:PilN domain-containing protein [Candidatus Eisenbacteria bacterium]